MSVLVGALQLCGESGEEPRVRLPVRLPRFRPAGLPAGHLDPMDAEGVGYFGLRQIPGESQPGPLSGSREGNGPVQ